MLFPQYEESVEVWRESAPLGYADPVWEYQTTIKGRFEPIQGTEVLINNQNFSDVTEMFLCDYTYRSSIRAGDGLVGIDGVQRRIAAPPEDWKWGLIQSHAASKCQRSQWAVK